MIFTKVDAKAAFKLFGQSIKAGFNITVTNTNNLMLSIFMEVIMRQLNKKD